MGPDAGRICIALRLQAVAQRIADMDRTSFAYGWPGAHGPHKARCVFLHLRALRQARGRIGMRALPVLREGDGRPGRGRACDGRGCLCRPVSS